jgi:hypothetical protein
LLDLRQEQRARLLLSAGLLLVPGAGSNSATEEVVRAPADGYTLLLVNPPKAINATL